ncbi:MAG: c-type cytochrome [Actinomycetota bacterium]
MRPISLILATGEETSSGPAGDALGVGAVALTVIIAVLLVWMAYLYINSRRSSAASAEPPPLNLSPAASDDELENRKLTRVLRSALFGSVLLAIALPWYAINEPGRQEAAAETIHEEGVVAGTHFFSHDGFACADCHGPSGGGGAAPFTEVRSGVDVSWEVPALDDVFYRYSEEEVRFWITFGRAGTPMPGNGLEGGGAMSVQEIDETLAYLQSIQLSQADAFAKTDGAVDRALAAIDGGEAQVTSLINKQQAEIDDVERAASELAVVGTFADDIKDLFQAPGTCTAESAALVGSVCENPGEDTDRDGLSDETEKELTAIAATSMETIVIDVALAPDAEGVVAYEVVPNDNYDVRFDSFFAFTNDDPATNAPAPDLDTAERFLSSLETDLLLIGVTAEKEDQFLEGLTAGLEFLEQSLDERAWDVDFDAAAAAMGVSVDEAKRGAGLFNAYCARCHTGGYSAGQAFEQGTGSGAWGPSLRDGRADIQFPAIEDQIAFVVSGSDNAVKYGVNGLGSGRMPGFGQVLSATDIELIVKYERSL